MFVYLWYEIFINILTFSGYSKASQRQGVSSLQSVSTAGTRSLGNRQGIYEFFLTCFSYNSLMCNRIMLIIELVPECQSFIKSMY